MFTVLGAVFGFLGVALGAFGAHGLKGTLAPEMLAVFETGVRYQVYHALALLALGLSGDRLPRALTLWAGRLFAGGVVVFSGSLSGLAVTGIKWLGAITPFGGAALLAGWAVLAVAAWRAR